MRKAIGLLAVLLCALAARAAQPVKVVGMEKAEFDKLPADTLLDVGGRFLTKAALLTEVGAAGAGASPRGGSGIDAAKGGAKFAEAEKGRLSALNAALKAKVRRPEVSKVATPPKTAVRPTITSVEPHVIEPGLHVLVNGIGFGEDAGEVRIVGNFPGGGYTLRTCNQGICTWYPAEIVGEVRDIQGVQDQNVSLVVVTKSGATSAPFPVQFRARRVQSCMRVVERSSVQGTPGLEGTCVQWQSEASIGVECIHKHRVIAAGTDRVSVNLKNGWVLTAYGMRPGLTQGVLIPLVSFTSGSPSMSASMNWMVLPELGGLPAYVTWKMDMCAVGPAGTPFN